MTPTRRTRLSALALPLLAALFAAGCSGDPLHLLPEAASPVAREVDELIYLIVYVTGATLVGVQAALVYFLFRYRARKGARAKYTHGNHAVEMTWTVLPALVLVLLAVYQAGMWKRMKSAVPEDNANAIEVQVFAKQFEWNFRYPGPDGAFNTADDRYSTGIMVVPVDRPVNIELRAMDVIHSFFLPNFRFKQDAVPGLHTKLWFRADKLSSARQPVADRDGVEKQLDYWDIVCAELCGSQHSAMSARLYVVPDEDYEKWVAGQPTTLRLPPNSLRGPEDSTTGLIWQRWHWQDSREIKGKPRRSRGVLLFGEEDSPDPEASQDDEEF